ncbi:MAG: signal recognition particle-docking protein FtsY [Paraglaciecola sp.]|uniref:signal recognition particle-docking protein FtsY n=1 Tax=Paraglaciecola sp. TaxID=1920173 RepID=UPI003296A29B
MSKFFKWLKKDKQPEASPVVIDPPQSEAERETALQSEPLKNDSSENTVLTSPTTDFTAQDEVKENHTLEADISPKGAIEEDLSESENIHSYKENDSKSLFQDSDVNHEPQLDSLDATSEKESTETLEDSPTPTGNNESTSELSIEQEDTQQLGFFSKLKRGLSRTKESIGSGFVSLFRGKSIDDDLFEELETQLLVADVGMNTTVKIIKHLTESSDRKQLKDGDALYQLLKDQMSDILKKVESPLLLNAESGPFVILMVGVNGVGKTTTIGKMAKQFQQQGKKVMLAAGDTFRAAAVEQLQVWGERNNIPVVAQQTGSDSASVIFDAFQSAKAKNIDVLIADTAGRLQNKDHLMEELKKVVRVMKKIAPEAPHEIMLTLDAGTGQNAVSQAQLFNKAVGLTGISLTKLDGTAKGGVIFAIADQFDIPIRYVGIGEGIDDLRPFNSQDFVNALFTESDNQPEQSS